MRQVASSSDQRAAANAAGLSSVAHSAGSGVRGLDGGAMAKALTEIALAPAFVTEIVMMIFPRGSHALGISLRDVSEVSAATKERKRGRQGRKFLHLTGFFILLLVFNHIIYLFNYTANPRCAIRPCATPAFKRNVGAAD